MCHRTERIVDGAREVVAEGGSRKPAGHPDLVAWQTVRGAILRESGPVVGGCAACGQPMVGEPGDAWVDWALQTPDGPVMVRAGALPAGHTVDALDTRLDEAWADRLSLADFHPAKAAFQGSLMGLLLVPVLVWMFAVGVVSLYLFTLVTDPANAIPGMGHGVTLP